MVFLGRLPETRGGEGARWQKIMSVKCHLFAQEMFCTIDIFPIDICREIFCC